MHQKRLKAFKFLRLLDIFSVPQKTYFHRHDPGLERTRNRHLYGSYCGGIVSIGFLVLLSVYVVNLLL